MKHAIIIMAHKDFEQLFHLIEYFSQGCFLFIHIDAKSTISNDILHKLQSFNYVKAIYKKFKIHWGGYSILKCEMFMLKEAIRLCDAGYFHLISGQDYPVRPLKHFLDFYDKNPQTDYIQYMHLPNPKWEGNTFTRFQYYFPLDWLSKSGKNNKTIIKLLQWQKNHYIKRRVPDQFPHLYGSSQWFTICRDSVIKLIYYTKRHPSLYRRMWMTFAPEESYIATVIVNLRKKNNVIPCNYRFIQWKYENGNCPANLNMEHFRYLLVKDCFFARKIERNCSGDLIQLIDRYLINEDSPIIIGQNGGWIYDGYLKYHYNHLFTKAVLKICQHFQIHDIVDIGCGSGLYVATLRSLGISISGYDANPYTEKLSKNLLPPNDEPCGQVDITESLEVKDTFDMVICKDVLPFIPQDKLNIALNNLSILCAKYLFISWCTIPIGVKDEIHYLNIQNDRNIQTLFANIGFKYIPGYTNYLRNIINENSSNSYFFFEKKKFKD